MVATHAAGDATDQALGALLLFGTNVAAIIATDVAVMLTARVRRVARDAAHEVGQLAGRSLAAVAASLVLVAVPLGLGTVSPVREQTLIADARPVADAWAKDQGWRVTDVFVSSGTLHAVALGALPEAGPETLRIDLDHANLGDVDLEVTLVVSGSVSYPGR